MKKMISILMFVLCGTMMTACIEDGPLPADDDDSPDAGSPDEPDATVPDEPDACPTTPPDAGTPEPDAEPVVPDAAPVEPDANCDDECGSDTDCSDGFGWTDDSCAAGQGDDPDVCVHVLNNCGGMQIRPSESAVTCVFWGGYNIPEPAPALGNFPPESLATGPAGGLWKSVPASACSVICYSSGGNPVALDLQIEWSGVTDSLTHAEYTGLMKGTFDGLNMQQ